MEGFASFFRTGMGLGISLDPSAQGLNTSALFGIMIMTECPGSYAKEFIRPFGQAPSKPSPGTLINKLHPKGCYRGRGGPEQHSWKRCGQPRLPALARWPLGGTTAPTTVIPAHLCIQKRAPKSRISWPLLYLHLSSPAPGRARLTPCPDCWSPESRPSGG